jgi:hypothetical protein
MNKPTIDWEKVAQARRRGKMGSMQTGDMELCIRAWKDDPERYKALSDEIVEQVIKEMRMLGNAREGDQE